MGLSPWYCTRTQHRPHRRSQFHRDKPTTVGGGVEGFKPASCLWMAEPVVLTHFFKIIFLDTTTLRYRPMHFCHRMDCILWWRSQSESLYPSSLCLLVRSVSPIIFMVIININSTSMISSE